MVAVVQTGDATDMVPLMGDPAGGVVGVNNKRDFQRQFLGGLVTKVGSPFAWRQGIFCPTSFDSHTPVDGRIYQSGGGGGTQAVIVKAHRSILTRASGEVYMFSQEADLALNVPAADGALPRIDLLCEMAYDKGAIPGDAQHGPKYITVTGDPAGSPTIPALPAAVADAHILARIARPAGDNTIADADITNVRKGVSLHGTPRVMMEGDALSDAGVYHGEQRLRIGSQFIATDYVNAGYVELVDRWDHFGQWRGTQSLILPKPTLATTASLGGATTFTLATVNIPDPGWPYRVDVSGSILYAIVGGASTGLLGVYLQFNIDSTTFAIAQPALIRRTGSSGNPSPSIIDLAGRRSAVLTGTHTVSFIIRNDSSPSNFLTWGDNEYAHCNVTIHPA